MNIIETKQWKEFKQNKMLDDSYLNMEITSVFYAITVSPF